MISRLKSFASQLLFVVVSTWIALWMVEGMARLAFHGTVFAPASDGGLQEQHATRGAALTPNSTMAMYQLAHAQSATINKLGFRGKDVGLSPESGKFRILLLSDSNGFGSGVADSETLAVQLQKELGDDKFEVLNFCVPAYSNVQEYLWLKEEGLALKPHLVLFGFTPVNDIQTNYQPLQALYQSNSKRPYVRDDGMDGFDIDYSFMTAHQEKSKGRKPLHILRDFFAGAMVQRLVDQAWERTTGGRKSDPNIWIGWPYLSDFSEGYGDGRLKNADYRTIWADAWSLTQRVIVAMRDESLKSGSQFVMFSHVGKIEGDPSHLAGLQLAYPKLKFDVGKAERELRQFAEVNKIAMISSSQQVKVGSNLFFGIDDDHMNASGYAVVAKALADDLRNQGLL